MYVCRGHAWANNEFSSVALLPLYCYSHQSSVNGSLGIFSGNLPQILILDQGN